MNLRNEERSECYEQLGNLSQPSSPLDFCFHNSIWVVLLYRE